MDQEAETEEKGDVTAAEDSQQPFPSPSNGTPLKPPLSEAKHAEEEDLEEDFDTPALVVSREDPGPPVEAPGKRKGKEKGSARPGSQWEDPYCPLQTDSH